MIKIMEKGSEMSLFFNNINFLKQFRIYGVKLITAKNNLLVY